MKIKEQRQIIGNEFNLFKKKKLHIILSNPKEKTMTTPILEIGKTNTRRLLKEKLTFSLRGETNILS